MSAMRSWCCLVGLNQKILTKEENLLLEAELFVHICKELKEYHREQYKDYFRLMKLTRKMEDAMLEANFLRLIIQDILSTEEYDLKGIACYTGIHEDAIEEVILGRNMTPSAMLLQRSIELHQSVRRDLYLIMMKKLQAMYSLLNSDVKKTII